MIDLDKLEASARERRIPVILGDSKEYLIGAVRESKPLRILEIGTAIGYSGIIMLREAMDGCILDTVELDASRRAEAMDNFVAEGVADRVNSYLGDATEIIPELCEKNKYDFLFIDGPKSKYAQYFETALPALNVGATVFADNVHFRGMVLSEKNPPHRYRTIVVNLRKYLDIISRDKYLTRVYDCGDGIAITKVK